MSSLHRYDTRFRERGVESPLSTKELRDRLVRRRVTDYNDDNEEPPGPEIAKPKQPEAAENDPPPKRTSSAATKPTVATSPPSKGFLMSSPAEVTVANMPSPQVSRIEERDSPSPGSAVAELENIRRSMTSSSSPPTLALNRSNASTRSNKSNTTLQTVNRDDELPAAERSHQTPRRVSPRPIKRTLSMESDVGSAKSSTSCGSLVTFAIVVAALGAATHQLWPLDRHFYLNRLFVADAPTMNATLSRDKFLLDLKSIRRDSFPSQGKQTWTVVGASVKSVFSQNKTMPACILLIGNTQLGQRTANCLAAKLARSFHKSIYPRAVEDLAPLDAGTLSGLERDEAKRLLFGALEHNLKTNHSFSLLNIHKLSGDVAMALHAFCDEGSVAASFPFSTLFMTIENAQPDDSYKSTESLADALLHAAWLDDIGIDKVSSLISRVAVSVATVAPESKTAEDCF